MSIFGNAGPGRGFGGGFAVSLTSRPGRRGCGLGKGVCHGLRSGAALVAHVGQT